MSAGAASAGLTRTDIARIVAARVAVSAAVLLFGFRSVSDDDFSRAVIAQQFAHAPRLDPSGTSWLPFPFWLNGAAMLVFGRSLLVAHAVALVLGAASSVLVAISAQRLTGDRRAAVLAGQFATLVGWSAWLGVAIVPELFTAALTLFAAASLATRSPRDRLLGALALLAATLSRYEPWPVAVAFALWNAAALVRLRGSPADLRGSPADLRGSPADLRDVPVVGRDERRGPSGAAQLALASVVALLGPALWIAWNRVSHGDALHFVARVTAYRRALGEAANESTLARVAAYPAALVREMPEAVIPAAVAALLAISPRARGAVLARAKACAAPLALATVQLVALSFALVKDGAPTHHPERAVLFPALALVVFASAFAPALPPERSRVLGVAALVLAARAAVMPALARWVGPDHPTLWAHIVRRSIPREAFVDRRPEVEIGALAAEAVPAGSRIYIEGVRDYGYFAILAGSARPEDLVPGGDPDPRSPKKQPAGFEGDGEEYKLWLHDKNITHVIAPGGERWVVPARWGLPPLHQNARFDLWRVP